MPIELASIAVLVAIFLIATVLPINMGVPALAAASCSAAGWPGSRLRKS